jgi:hypothetical protein
LEGGDGSGVPRFEYNAVGLEGQLDLVGGEGAVGNLAL